MNSSRLYKRPMRREGTTRLSRHQLRKIVSAVAVSQVRNRIAFFVAPLGERATFMTMHPRRRVSLKWLRLLALALAATILLPATPAIAHESLTWPPSGRSPFYAGYSFSNTGNYYGQKTHVDYYSGTHNNDYYALDLNPSVDGHCGRKLYAMWGNMTVTIADTTNGFLRMQGSPTGSGTYRLEYRHMSSIEVSKGQRVSRGTDVGNVGKKGHASGCHLHLAIRKYIDGSWKSVRPVICGAEVKNRTPYKGCT